MKILTSILAITIMNSVLLAEEPKMEKAEEIMIEKNPESFEYTTYISADSKKVWEYIVTPKHVNSYFMCPMSKIDLKKGGDIIYADGLISGKITKIEEGVSLKHTFKFAHHKEEKESSVEYILKPIGEVTMLTIIHDGFGDESKSYHDIVGGWPVIMSQLKTFMETGKKIPWPKPDKQ